MKTLIVEDKPMRAQSWIALFSGPSDVVHVAHTIGQARLMMLATCYDRLCLRRGAQQGGSYALLSVARATNPDCEIVDLASVQLRGAALPNRVLHGEAFEADRP